MNPIRSGVNLIELQNYVKNMEQERGFSNQTVIHQALLLGEEVGELFCALRKHVGLKIDSSKINIKQSISDELADVLIYLVSIANRCDVDLEKALQDKEAINSKRKWS
jgi:NTP pyrophosphatase (non-canonical NTP hydrolase)